MRRREVAILVFDGVEVLDFAGPFEVFAVTDELNGERYFDVSLVAPKDTEYAAVNGMRVLPNRVLGDLPAPDVLVIPGGDGSKQAMRDRAVLEWIREARADAEVVMSVCSGARLLAVLGMLDGLDVTTHHEVAADLEKLAPAARVSLGRRFIDNGRIVTTGGISAGIDGSFHVVARLLGERVAQRTAEYMEYDWTPEDRYPT